MSEKFSSQENHNADLEKYKAEYLNWVKSSVGCEFANGNLKYLKVIYLQFGK